MSTHESKILMLKYLVMSAIQLVRAAQTEASIASEELGFGDLDAGAAGLSEVLAEEFSKMFLEFEFALN